MKKENRIAFRVTDQEKKRITALAKKCGLSISEYVKQRALGYAPQPVLPEVIFPLLMRIKGRKVEKMRQKRGRSKYAGANLPGI